jgi:hypothetical protein
VSLFFLFSRPLFLDIHSYHLSWYIFLARIGGLVVDQSAYGGLGLTVTQAVPANTVIMAVPSKVALSVESPGGGPDDRGPYSLLSDRKVMRDSPWFAQFSLYLYTLDKISSKRGSIDMRPWLDSLPRQFDTPIHWSETAKEALQYPHLRDAVSRQQVDWRAHYDALTKAGTPAMKMTWNDFVWGCECARSRAFSGAYTGAAFNPLIYAFTLLLVTVYVGLGMGELEQAANGGALVVCASILKDFVVPKLFKTKRYVICPVVDMANHKSLGTSGVVSFEFFGDAYALASSGTVGQGSELSISYGVRSNDQLLQYYGFVETDNPHDVYVMPPLREWKIDALEEAVGRTFSPGRLQKLDKVGLLGSTVTTADAAGDENANPNGGVVIMRATGIDPAVMIALRALVSSDREWQDAGEAIGNFAAEGSGGAENERLARLAAKTALELELASKPTTIAQDVELLKRMKASKSMDSSPEETLPILFRLEKKKLLKEIIETLQ